MTVTDISVLRGFEPVAFTLYRDIHKGIRAELGKGAGDSVTVTVERDDAVRTVDVPDDLAAADDSRADHPHLRDCGLVYLAAPAKARRIPAADWPRRPPAARR